jgi:hypothetical protein
MSHTIVISPACERFYGRRGYIRGWMDLKDSIIYILRLEEVCWAIQFCPNRAAHCSGNAQVTEDQEQLGCVVLDSIPRIGVFFADRSVAPAEIEQPTKSLLQWERTQDEGNGFFFLTDGARQLFSIDLCERR